MFTMSTEHIILLAMLVWNVLTFSLYALDKSKAKRNRHRIKESTLILCAFAMGGPGALLGMILLRHKTRKTAFRILVPLAVLVNIIVVFILNSYSHFS